MFPANSTKETERYKYELIDPNIDIEYITYGWYPDRNLRALNRFRQKPKKFLCINDVLNHNNVKGKLKSLNFQTKADFNPLD